jgi:hypothetical protein
MKSYVVGCFVSLLLAIFTNPYHFTGFHLLLTFLSWIGVGIQVGLFIAFHGIPLP